MNAGLRRIGPAALALVACGLLAAAGARAADIRRLEVLGVAPAPEKPEVGDAARRAALDAGLVTAVGQVCEALVGPAGQGPGGTRPADAAEWVRALGGKATAYVVGYRVLEDRGQRAASEPGAAPGAKEEVLLVEVHVEAGRLGQALRKAGFATANQDANQVALEVRVEPLPSARAWRSLEESLARIPGAEVVPETFAADGGSLRVDSSLDARATLAHLQSDLPSGLEVEPLEVSGGRLVLRLREAPPAPGPDAPSFDTQVPNRY